MTINERLINALESIAPISPNEYTGNSSCYIVFTVNEFPVLFGDDVALFERMGVQVHFFCPLGYNSISKIKSIKKALREAKFTYPSRVDASDSESQHYVFECEYFSEAEE